MQNAIFQLLSTARQISSNGLIAKRQLVELKKQIPTLYCLLLVNTCMLAVTHYHIAPAYLTIGLPMTMASFGLIRVVQCDPPPLKWSALWYGF
jgi:predicted signal transduction protein with EAL and GGDEF domain